MSGTYVKVGFGWNCAKKRKSIEYSRSLLFVWNRRKWANDNAYRIFQRWRWDNHESDFSMSNLVEYYGVVDENLHSTSFHPKYCINRINSESSMNQEWLKAYFSLKLVLPVYSEWGQLIYWVSSALDVGCGEKFSCEIYWALIYVHYPSFCQLELPSLQLWSSFKLINFQHKQTDLFFSFSSVPQSTKYGEQATEQTT